MAEHRYEIRIDRATNIIHVRLWEYWLDDEAEGYRREMEHAIDAMQKSGRPWFVLGDVTNSPPQSPITQRIRQGLLEHGERAGMHKIAYVVAQNALTKTQMERVNERAGAPAAFFTNKTEAEAWLRQSVGHVTTATPKHTFQRSHS